MNKIILAGQEFEVPELPFKQLRQVICSINRLYKLGADTDEGTAEIPKVFGLLIGKSPAEVDAMPITLQEMQAALEQIPEMIGLVQGSASSGEAPAVTDGTTSTATS